MHDHRCEYAGMQTYPMHPVQLALLQTALVYLMFVGISHALMLQSSVVSDGDVLQRPILEACCLTSPALSVRGLIALQERRS